ncbi:TPA: hypothetical protein SOL41_003096 [Clostridioides difficile]|nr:hypothetical protein [Clostridioides difficile]HDF5661359.1 hypothetical protein [Clostridioides difficile]HEK4598411.1 hypothetical protein [Clostridioides difficile]HEK4612956.1 hypothetical protein [Clostridioides difficile]HEK4617216.1 hypothetical protein [Clostridioides difficile]
MSKTKKEFFNATKKFLEEYNQIDANINKLKGDICNLDKCSVGDLTKAISYDSIPTSKTYNINNKIEDKLVSIEDKKTEKEIELYTMMAIKKTLDIAINNLRYVEREIIKFRYINKFEWFQISDKLFMEERQLRRRRDIAIASISIAMFGRKALTEQEPIFNLLEIQ